MTSTIAATRSAARSTTIPEFGGLDAKLYSTAEIGRLIAENGKPVKDVAAWLRRRKIATTQRVWRGGARFGTVRITLADPAAVLANLGAPAFAKEL